MEGLFQQWAVSAHEKLLDGLGNGAEMQSLAGELAEAAARERGSADPLNAAYRYLREILPDPDRRGEAIRLVSALLFFWRNLPGENPPESANSGVTYGRGGVLDDPPGESGWSRTV